MRFQFGGHLEKPSQIIPQSLDFSTLVPRPPQGGAPGGSRGRHNRRAGSALKIPPGASDGCFAIRRVGLLRGDRRPGLQEDLSRAAILVKRGRLTVPVIGVAKAGWTLDDLKKRGPRQRGKARRHRRNRLWPLERSAAVRRWRLQRSFDVRETARGTRAGQASGPLSGHSAGFVSAWWSSSWASRAVPTELA